MRFKKSPQLPGAGRTREWHYHGSHTPTSPGAILQGKIAYPPKQIRRECNRKSNAVMKMNNMIHQKSEQYV